MSFVGGYFGFGQGYPVFVFKKSDLLLGFQKFVQCGGVLKGDPGAEPDLFRDFPSILFNEGNGF